jgi:predicted sulfurtransferase
MKGTASRAARAGCAALIAVATAPARPKLSEVTPMSEDKRVKAEDIDSVMQDGKVFFLDVREPKELEEFGTYEGYVNIPMSQLESRLGELPKDRPILTA